MDKELLGLLCKEIREKHLPVQIQNGFSAESENGNEATFVQIDYADDFDLNGVLCRIINKAIMK